MKQIKTALFSNKYKFAFGLIWLTAIVVAIGQNANAQALLNINLKANGQGQDYFIKNNGDTVKCTLQEILIGKGVKIISSDPTLPKRIKIDSVKEYSCDGVVYSRQTNPDDSNTLFFNT